MNADGINQVLREVFGEGGKEINGWISIRCPLARWQAEHRHGRDTRESAGISINPTGTSIFNCFTCDNKAPFHAMLKRYADYTGEDLGDLIGEIEEESYLGPRVLPDWDTPRADDDELHALARELYLDLYDSAAGHPYLIERGISDETAGLLQLMIDPHDPADGAERILFPVFGPGGDLYGLTGRDVTGQARLKVRDYYGLKKAACLLGSHLIAQTKPDKILVVEGLFDYANGWECGQPAVAVMHSTMTEKQAAILKDFGLPVYLFYDNDAAGEKGVKNAGTLIEKYVPVMKVKYPADCKDPGELQPEEFESMIRGARLF